MHNHSGALYIKRAGKYVRYLHTGADVQELIEWKKVQSESLLKYHNAINENASRMEMLERKLNHTQSVSIQYQETIKGLDRRTREYQEAVREKDALIAVLKANLLTLQAKVEELDARLAGQSELHKAVETFKRIEAMPVKQTPFDITWHDQTK